MTKPLSFTPPLSPNPSPINGRATVFEVKSFLGFLPVDKWLTKARWI